MHNDVGYGQSFLGIRAKHLKEQIFEFWTHRCALFKDAPVFSLFVVVNEFVVGVSGFCLVKWLALRNHHEEADCQGEQVSLCSLVASFLEHLWSHVTRCSLDILESGISSGISAKCAESKIAKFDIHICIH